MEGIDSINIGEENTRSLDDARPEKLVGEFGLPKPAWDTVRWEDFDLEQLAFESLKEHPVDPQIALENLRALERAYQKRPIGLLDWEIIDTTKLQWDDATGVS
jgi:hypothetical protein